MLDPGGRVVPIVGVLRSGTSGGPLTVRLSDGTWESSENNPKYSTLVFHTETLGQLREHRGPDLEFTVRIDGTIGAPRPSYQYRVTLVDPAGTDGTIDRMREPYVLTSCQLTSTCSVFLTNGWDGGIAENEFTFGDTRNPTLVGDWDGDGIDDVGTRRGNQLSSRTRPGAGPIDVDVAYGRVTDQVLIGAWDGDGQDTLAMRRENRFYFTNDGRGGEASFVMDYGRPGDEVFVGDWDGDGKDTIALRRGNVFHVTNSVSGGRAESEVGYERVGDAVFVGDWDGDGKDTLAVRRGNMWFIRNTLSTGVADREMAFGRGTDVAFVGDWDGDGVDTIGVRR